MRTPWYQVTISVDRVAAFVGIPLLVAMLFTSSWLVFVSGHDVESTNGRDAVNALLAAQLALTLFLAFLATGVIPVEWNPSITIGKPQVMIPRAKAMR